MNWKKVKLESVCAIIAGQSPPSSTYNTDAIGLPFFQGKADFGITSPKVRIWCSSPQKIAEPNDILLSVRAPVGPTNICNQKSCIGRGLSAIRANNNIYFKYILYFFKQLEPKLTLSGVGSTFGSITQTDIKNLEIPLPDLATQKHIAEVLDKADALRQQNRQLLANYDELLQSTFIELFGDPVKNPKGWEVKKLEGLIEDGPKNGLYKSSKEYGEGNPILRIDSFYDGKVTNISSLKRVKASDKEIEQFQILKDDIVINRVNSRSHLGKCALIPHLNEITLFESNMMRIRFNTSLNSLYASFILSSPYVKKQILERAKDAVNQSSINQEDVKSFQIPVPPLPLQQHFAKIVEQIEAQKAQAQTALTESEALFEGLLAGYFNA